MVTVPDDSCCCCCCCCLRAAAASSDWSTVVVSSYTAQNHGTIIVSSCTSTCILSSQYSFIHVTYTFVHVGFTYTVHLQHSSVTAFAVCGPDICNDLPPSLRTTTSHSAFRRSLKTQFYNLAFLS